MRIWLDEPVPARYGPFWKRFQDLHPDAEFVTFDRSDDLDWMDPGIREVMDRQRTWAGKSDVLRYAAVHHFGGVYVDTDVEPLRTFDPLLEEDTAFVAWEAGRLGERPRLLCPTVIGAPAGHAALRDLLDFLPRWSANGSRNWMHDRPNLMTGPHPLTHVWRHRDDVRRLPMQTFYPVGWGERDRLGGPYPEESYAVHHWDAGWLDGGPGSQIVKVLA
jgi:mannosyltransferase OCH1-like enzyme